MRKKILLLILCLIASLFIFGCASNSDKAPTQASSQTEEVTIQSSNGKIDDTSSEIALFIFVGAICFVAVTAGTIVFLHDCHTKRD